MKKFGLIGKKLAHSFSKNYFTKKFDTLALHTHQYDLYELSEIGEITTLLNTPSLRGLNVTVPFKESVIPYLDGLDVSAKGVGAVNVIKIHDGLAIGYNSDYLAFKESLKKWLPDGFKLGAIILGTGGASKAVAAALNDMGITYALVSRSPNHKQLSYEQAMGVPDLGLVINTTPLGMYPHVEHAPPIDYSFLSESHYLYDLVYNPEMTTFLKRGAAKGAKTKNGLEMLHLQAEASWGIWTSD